MREIGFALLLGFGGTIAAALYTFFIGFAGLPGALLTTAAAKRRGDSVTPLWGLFLTMAGQLYASLAFVALVIQFTDNRLREAAGFGKWFAWTVAFFVAVAPVGIALKDAARSRRRNIQHSAMAFAAPLTVIGFFLFSFFPAIMNAGWGWVPGL